MNRVAPASALLLLFLLAACASTPKEEVSQYWAARRSFVATQSAYNDFLRLDNTRIREGKHPLLSERDRQVALLITREAYHTFEELEPMLGDESHRAEVLLGIGQIQTLGFQLTMLYLGKGGTS
jgi:hypothetical protein